MSQDSDHFLKLLFGKLQPGERLQLWQDQKTLSFAFELYDDNVKLGVTYYMTELEYMNIFFPNMLVNHIIERLRNKIKEASNNVKYDTNSND